MNDTNDKSLLRMHCWSCEKETEFDIVDIEEGPQCCECGHYQTSEAAGALELCEVATWHDMAEYQRVAAIARAAGYSVSDHPRYFTP